MKNKKNDYKKKYLKVWTANGDPLSIIHPLLKVEMMCHENPT